MTLLDDIRWRIRILGHPAHRGADGGRHAVRLERLSFL